MRTEPGASWIQANTSTTVTEAIFREGYESAGSDHVMADLITIGYPGTIPAPQAEDVQRERSSGASAARSTEPM